MEHYTLLLRQLFSTPYFEKDNINVQCTKYSRGVYFISNSYILPPPPLFIHIFSPMKFIIMRGCVPHAKNWKPLFCNIVNRGNYFSTNNSFGHIFAPVGGVKQKNKHPVVQYCTVHCSRIVDCTYLYDPPPLWQYTCTMYNEHCLSHSRAKYIFQIFAPRGGMGSNRKIYIPVVQYSKAQNSTVHCSRIVDCTYLYDPPPLLTINMYKYIVFLIVGSAK